MMVSKSINIVCRKCIQDISSLGVKPRGQEVKPINGDEVGSAYNRFNGNDASDALPSCGKVRRDHPEPCFFVGLVSVSGEPVNERAVVLIAMVHEREEKSDATNEKSSKTREIGVTGCEDAVVSRMATPPRGRCSNAFTSEPIDSGRIARGIEGYSCGMINVYTFIGIWAE